MNFKHLLLAFLVLPAFLFQGCSEDPEIVNPEEVITTLRVTFTPTSGSAVTFEFSDPDGDGGTAPTITNGTLAANTTYVATLEVLNESETPVEDITEEIAEEDDEHQFFFQTGAGLNLVMAYSDADDDGNPIGLTNAAVTGDASTGSLTVTLRHEPSKDIASVQAGDIAEAGGETDIEVTFTVTVQ